MNAQGLIRISNRIQVTVSESTFDVVIQRKEIRNIIEDRISVDSVGIDRALLTLFPIDTEQQL